MLRDAPFGAKDAFTDTPVESEPMSQVPLPSVHHWSLGGEILAFGSVVGAVFGVLPSIATFLGIVWYSLMIWENDAFRRWRDRNKEKSDG